MAPISSSALVNVLLDNFCFPSNAAPVQAPSIILFHQTSARLQPQETSRLIGHRAESQGW